MNHSLKKIKFIGLSFLISLLFLLFTNIIYASDKITIVIDPGHGGTNEGADFNGIKEKYITLKTALSLKEELEKYSDFNVYITRTEDTDLSLMQRALFAKKCNADFVLSIHYNASANHDRFGSEVWIPSDKKYYNLSYGLAYNIINEFKNAGLADRGIKTRIGDDEKDYYGIIRNSVEQEIPAMIIEHCFMDNKNDEKYYLSEQSIIDFGKLDANAVLKYFDIKKSENNKNNFKIPDISSDDNIIYPDKTPPENVSIKLNNYNKNGIIDLNIYAEETESALSYFSYSIDGGINWSELKKWEDKNNIFINSDIYSNKSVIVRVYNGYDKFTQSNIINISALEKEQNENNKESSEKFKNFINTARLFTGVVFFIFIIFLLNRFNQKNKNI